MNYEAVVFDMDGVLVEFAEEAVYDAVRTAFAECGVEDPPAEHVEATTAGVTVSELRSVCAPHDLDPETFWRTRDAAAARAQIRAARAGDKQPYDDVTALGDLDRPMAVVSSNQQATVDFVLEHHGLAERFEVAYGRAPTLEDLRRKKPEPYFLERVLDDLGVDRALFVGDSPSDVQAARRAGLDSAFVRRPHRADMDPSIEPTHEIESLWRLPELAD